MGTGEIGGIEDEIKFKGTKMEGNEGHFPIFKEPGRLRKIWEASLEKNHSLQIKEDAEAVFYRLHCLIRHMAHSFEKTLFGDGPHIFAFNEALLR